MALTVDGKVFSWGEGDDGKLGHYSRTYVTDYTWDVGVGRIVFVE